MIKKVVVGALLVGLSGMLIVGAVRRTQDKTATESGRGQGRGQSAADVQNEDGTQARYGQQREEGERAAAGAAGGSDNRIDLATANWVTREGAVAACDASLLAITATDGDPCEIQGRAWSYAQEQGFTAGADDWLVVLGFYEAGEFKPAQIENRTTDQVVLLRDETGRPMWSGGRGGRNG